MAAWCTTAHAAPPPWWMRLKNERSPMPTLRAISISALLAMVNVTMTTTSEGTGPVGDEAAHEAVRREDVHEDVLGSPLLGEVAVVVDVLVVARGEGGGDDQRGRELDDQLGQLGALDHLVEAQRRGRGHAGRN